MDLWDTNKLVLFIAFVIPGFITLKYYDLLTARPPRDSSQQIIDAVAYSCINYAILLGPIVSVEKSDWKSEHPAWYAAFYIFVLLIAPVSWASLFRWVRSWQCFQKVMPHPTHTAWDFFFSRRQGCWMVVTLDTGEKIGGRYGSSSFVSSAPATEIYLQEHWVVNEKGGLARQRVDTEGILILSKSIRAIEFFKFKPAEVSDVAKSE